MIFGAPDFPYIIVNIITIYLTTILTGLGINFIMNENMSENSLTPASPTVFGTRLLVPWGERPLGGYPPLDGGSLDLKDVS
jgi:hypothetical protein